MKDNDSLGDRMKLFEGVTRTRLMPKTPVMLRLDGKAFHTLTRGMDKPVDKRFQAAMYATAKALCEEVQGCQLAYVQSDEITLLLVDYQTYRTQSWFDYEIMKMCSVAAGIASAHFSGCYDDKVGIFDCRAWNLPQHEVVNALIWRQQDATRNSISSLAQSHFSPKELHGKDSVTMQDMLVLEKKINWNDCPVPQKRGVCVVKETYEVPVSGRDEISAGKFGPMETFTTTRTRWVVDENIPVFTQDRQYIDKFVYPPEEEAKTASAG